MNTEKTDRMIPEPRAKDRYDEAVEYLTAHPEEIYKSWANPYCEPGGCLFGFYTKEPAAYIWDAYGSACGCLTQAKAGQVVVYNKCKIELRAFTQELTDEIRNDPRIPNSPPNQGLAESIAYCKTWAPVLPVFAEYRRKLDAAREKAKEQNKD